jgi:uncharacterized Zn-binding protein involved in type VI secretion
MIAPGAVTDWIPIAGMGRGGDGHGFWQTPDIGTQALLVFPGGSLSGPVVLGFIFDREHRPPAYSAGKAADSVVYQTKNHRVEIIDEEGKETILITTAKGKIRYTAAKTGGIQLVNGLGDIKIKCRRLKLGAEAGLSLQAEKKLNISGGENILLRAAKNAGIACDGKAALRAKNIRLEGSRGVTAEGRQMAKNGDKVMGVDIHKMEVPAGRGTQTVPLPHPYIGKLADKLSANVKINGQNAAAQGSKSKHNDSKHMQLPGTLRFTKPPSKEGEVSGGTIQSVLINRRAAAVTGSAVSTCNDMGAKNNSVIMAAGSSLPMPVIINPQNTEDYNREREQDGQRRPEFINPRWNKTAVDEGGGLELSVQVRDINDGNLITFQVWNEGQDPASHIAWARIPAGIEGGIAKAEWFCRTEAEGVPPDMDPKFFFTAHSAWCPAKRSGTVMVRLKRPELSQPLWKDAEGRETSEGLTGAALSLSVSCNADMREGAAVIFRVYPEGAEPEKDAPAAEREAPNKGGSAAAEWTYHYKHDPAKPLKAKPRFFFTASGQRSKTIKSGILEISQNLEILLLDAKENPAKGTAYTLFLPGGNALEGKTGDDGIISGEGFIPGIYEVLIRNEEEKNE